MVSNAGNELCWSRAHLRAAGGLFVLRVTGRCHVASSGGSRRERLICEGDVRWVSSVMFVGGAESQVDEDKVERKRQVE